ncbi:acyl-CoA dehydrogenase family protein [Arthrobacter sp. zg-Y820]|uniref:acyl-CoA dehydrogenase family protein n=1 Tax=unclassified Arthrobacter TaxID=235627 RepID=UPI001E5883D8|nr:MULTISPECIES: acyl-CoA dehydrogenase family protein [unclassified Arthrobacter]MCC9197697.1 acyl-CoA dehydrogenase family protein [Arthrobacter sp. zg-Y820]MDK1280564.1 acyl-CoA dehydrogenase family protein [Arthrobacter sp. zg.Y820]WIB10798.1 acyl-CoA dehydrogenase family protein [Arthrobacter sp. zg-Y820]
MSTATSTGTADATGTEPVEEFRLRARAWLAENLPPAADTPAGNIDDDVWLRARVLQGRIHAGGFAGICFPKEYGGLGLGPDHQHAFNEEAAGYELPIVLNVPSVAICAATILDLGTEEQKKQYLPGIISGRDVWCQLLSEPGGGSDLAGVITKSERNGEDWTINGSKVWSSAAYAADYGLCLTRSNWDVPKHSGLTMFILPLKAPGVTVHRIKLVNGANEFCQVFFDDVRLPAGNVVGAVDDGWATASQQLFHERNAMGGGSPYVSGPRFSKAAHGPNLLELARETGQLGDTSVRDQLADVRIMQVVSKQLVRRIGSAIATGELTPQASSILRLFEAERTWTEYDAAFRIAGANAVAGPSLQDPGHGQAGLRYLSRQAGSLGGGSTEIARNIISERVLGMPREAAADRGVAFKDVKRGGA